MFYFVKIIANYLLTNKLPPRVINPDLYPELRPRVYRRNNIPEYLLPPRRYNLQHLTPRLPEPTHQHQVPQPSSTPQRPPLSPRQNVEREKKSSDDFFMVDASRIDMPVSGVTTVPHMFPEFSVRRESDESDMGEVVNRTIALANIPTVPPAFTRRSSSYPPMELQSLGVRRPESRNRLMSQNPNDDFVYTSGDAESYPDDTQRSQAVYPPNYTIFVTQPRNEMDSSRFLQPTYDINQISNFPPEHVHTFLNNMELTRSEPEGRNIPVNYRDAS